MPERTARDFTGGDLAYLVSALVHAGRDELMPRFGNLEAHQIGRKSSAFDIVTEADEAAEQAIVAALSARFPHAALVGEEAAHKDPGLIAHVGAAELAFVIDPLDGTHNFASGVPLFGVMAAAIVRDEVVAGAIHDPITATTVMALRGAGAWSEDRSGARTVLRVADAVPLAQIDGVVATNFLPEPVRSSVGSRLSRLGMTYWLRCAAHEYRLAASGHCRILFYNKLMPWDHAAGWLIHREAGGFSAHFDGTPYRPSHTTGGLLCAPDEASFEDVRSALLGEAADGRTFN